MRATDSVNVEAKPSPLRAETQVQVIMESRAQADPLVIRFLLLPACAPDVRERSYA